MTDLRPKKRKMTVADKAARAEWEREKAQADRASRRRLSTYHMTNAAERRIARLYGE
jgi:hypothetical protein